MAKKTEKLGIEVVEYVLNYDNHREYDRPFLFIKRKDHYGNLRIEFQRHRLDYHGSSTLYGYYDVMEYRRATGQASHALWDVGTAAFSMTYAPTVQGLRFDGYNSEIEWLAGLKKELDKVKIEDISADPMTAYAQKLTKLGADVKFRYCGSEGEWESPYHVPDHARNRTQAWANSAEACRIVAKEETERAKRKEEEVNNNQQEVA